LACDVLGRVTGRRFVVSAARVRKYAANTRFANARCLASGFVPRHDLHNALAATIRHEFAPHTASATAWGLAPRQVGRDP
jgi:hypothetical protein